MAVKDRTLPRVPGVREPVFVSLAFLILKRLTCIRDATSHMPQKRVATPIFQPYANKYLIRQLWILIYVMLEMHLFGSRLYRRLFVREHAKATKLSPVQASHKLNVAHVSRGHGKSHLGVFVSALLKVWDPVADPNFSLIRDKGSVILAKYARTLPCRHDHCVSTARGYSLI